MNPFKNKKGLGRGLSSLIGDADIRTTTKNKVLVSSLERNKYQPRKVFDAENLNELSNSIKERGIIQPIVVRKKSKKEKTWKIIAGERRWRAAQKAGLKDVPVTIQDINEEQVALIALIENIQREDRLH